MKKSLKTFFVLIFSMFVITVNLLADDGLPTLSEPAPAKSVPAQNIESASATAVPAPATDEPAVADEAPVVDSATTPSTPVMAAEPAAVKSAPNQAVTSAKRAEQQKQQSEFVDMLILYFPNRVMDFLDTFDVSLGFGPVVKAKVWATRYLAFGGGVGGSAKVIKAYNRQYGAGLESGWSASFMMLTAENTELYETTRGVQRYFEYHTGIPSLDDNVYNFWRGPRDMFSIGVEAAIFGEIDAEIHPFEIIDFAAGLFFLDPKGDDIKMSDIEGK